MPFDPEACFFACCVWEVFGAVESLNLKPDPSKGNPSGGTQLQQALCEQTRQKRRQEETRRQSTQDPIIAPSRFSSQQARDSQDLATAPKETQTNTNNVSDPKQNQKQPQAVHAPTPKPKPAVMEPCGDGDRGDTEPLHTLKAFRTSESSEEHGTPARKRPKLENVEAKPVKKHFRKNQSSQRKEAKKPQAHDSDVTHASKLNIYNGEDGDDESNGCESDAAGAKKDQEANT